MVVFNCDVQRRLRWNLSNRMRLHSPHSRFGCCRGSCRRCWWSSRGCGVFLSTTVVSNRGFLLLLSATKVLSNAVICNHHFRFPRVLGFWKAQKNLLRGGLLNFVSSTAWIKLRAWKGDSLVSIIYNVNYKLTSSFSFASANPWSGKELSLVFLLVAHPSSTASKGLFAITPVEASILSV